jgi:microcin C transport system substrate-binding protein
MRLILCAALLLPNLLFASESQHGIAMHGDLKYKSDFKHFDYASPTAPKGGTLKRAVVGDNFDSFNPFIVKGVAAAGIGYLYETLTTHAEDEAFSEYGLIAEKIEVPKDRSSVTFYLNKNAKFSDGSAITAEDVAFSYQTLTGNERARPFYGAYYGDVKSVTIIDRLTIKFESADSNNRELPLILGQMPILSKRYWQANDFGTASLSIPVGNGPYIVESFVPGRSITYARNPSYWAKDLPVNVGKYNFDKVIYEYYKDNTVALEAFKAGEYDFRVENTARNWANAYEGSKFDDGTLIKEEVTHQRPTGLQAFVINTRRPQFNDVKVRKALDYAFDFEWTNQNLFNGQYRRADNYFENSELASEGMPTPAELKILEPFKAQVPASVFTAPYVAPSTAKPSSLRKNLRTATKLLNEAGWRILDGQLRHDKHDKPMTFEFLLYQKDFERIVQPYIKNLNKLGIQASIRVVDTTQYINRMRDFDFDIMVSGFGQSNSPGNEQRDYWHSSRAAQVGSRNLPGISDPVIDALVDLVISAPDRNSLINRTKVLDRVLLAGHYVIPNWYNPFDRIAYSNRLARPGITPKSGVSIDTWWIK